MGNRHPLIRYIHIPSIHPPEKFRIALFQVPSIPVHDHPWKIYNSLVDQWKPHYVLFPEHVWDPEGRPHASEILNVLVQKTRHWYAYIIAGTWIDKYTMRSVSTGLYHGEVMFQYEKIHPTPGEQKGGIRPGNTLVILDTGMFQWSVLICADIFEPDLFKTLGNHAVKLIFLPTASPYKPDDTIQKQHERDTTLYQQNAQRINGVLVKACTLGYVHVPLQGRSLLALPDRILFRVAPDEHNLPLFVTADIECSQEGWQGKVLEKRSLAPFFTPMAQEIEK